MAVLLVVLFHAGIEFLQGGFVGVDVFFVLSGYLITGLLVQEAQRTGGLDFRRFYARRARRLLPAAALVTLMTLLASEFMLSPLELGEIARSARATAAYLSNVRFMIGATDYFAATNETNPLLHTWSLAVEEQFYFLWPFLLLLGIRGTRSRTRLTLLIIAVTVASFAGCLWLTRVRQPWAFFGSPARAWEFGVGALACLIPSAFLHARRHLSIIVGVLGLFLLGVSATQFAGSTRFPGLAALLPVFGTAAILVAGVGAPGTGVGRLLEIPPLQYLGRLSYSWYLWHWPVLIFAQARFGTLSLPESLVAVGLALGIAAIAYQFVENPVRFQPRLLAAPASRTLWLAGAATFGCIAAATVVLKVADVELTRAPYRNLAEIAADRGRIYTDGCMVPLNDATVRECVYGNPSSSFSVVAFGDSHTAHWFPALEKLARDRDWKLVYFVKSGCPSTSVAIYRPVLKRVEPECTNWRWRVFARIRQLHPRVVVLSNSYAYVKRAGVHDATASLTLAEWRAGTRRTLAALASTDSYVLLLRDSPKPRENIPLCLARAARLPWYRREACTMRRDQSLSDDVYAAETVASHGLANVKTVDLSSSFCDDSTCTVLSNGMVRYSDDSHITPEFALSLAPVLGHALDQSLSALRMAGNAIDVPASSGR